MGTSAKFEGSIQPWGNSLGLRITKAIGDLAHLGKGTKVVVEVTEAGLVVRPKKPGKYRALPYTEREMVAGLTAHTAHADELPKLQLSEIGG